ncbi:hypothetical protein C7M84_003251 [Penaeus vannamei]|uniref:Uncharacterized protein n=1 Tax=Penaeus vannamei TaxID=6689 RepID=A0A423TNP4_PENVA|nr:hypothetical protein C7M84_003251 [Penaeus vannamei]
MALGRGLLWGFSGPCVLLLLLQLGVLAEGRIYQKRRMSEIETFRQGALEVCVEPFSQRARVDLRLKVMNRGSAKVVPVGIVSLRKNQLSDGAQHTVTANHFVEEGEHKMIVLVDGTYTPYEKTQVYAPSDEYVFYGFSISLRNGMGRQLTGPTENDDMTFDDPSEEVVPSVEAGTESTIQTNATSEREEWWDFVWKMGNFKGVPVLLLLIVTLIVGLVLGALCTLCCEVYFSRRRDVDKGHEVDRKFSNYTSFRPDYYPRLSTTTTLTSTLNNARVDNEANHSNPLSQCPPPSPPCSSPADTYSMPHDAHRERAGSVSVHDETLPLNYPLTYPDRDPQNSKLLHTFGGQSYRESEYQ